MRKYFIVAVPILLIIIIFVLLISLPRNYPAQLEYAKTLLQNNKGTNDVDLQNKIIAECKTALHISPSSERNQNLRHELATALAGWKRYSEAIYYFLEFANSTLNSKLSEEAYINAISICEEKNQLIQLCEDFIDKFHYSQKREEIYFTLIKLKKEGKTTRVIKYCYDFLLKFQKSRFKHEVLYILESTLLRDGKKLEAFLVQTMPLQSALYLISTLSSLARIQLLPSFQ